MPYDPETGDVYDTLSYLDDVDPETFDWDGLADEMNSTAQEVYKYACEVDGTDDELEEFDEGWLGDKMKAGWDAVKKGAKKVGKAIGDAFNGPFRKGDQIVMKGEDGESFKGTIMDYDRGDKTYEVMLGKAVNEDWDGRGLEEDVLDMPDRVDELEAEIEKLWVRLGDIDEDTVQKLIADYVELDKIEPGRVDFLKESKLVNEETREEIAYLKSIGEYDDYKKMIRALKAKNAKKKSTKKPTKRKFGGASKKSARKPISRPAAKKEYKYSFSASGYGTKTYSFPSEEECLKEMKQDAEATAEDYGGEVQWWDDKECVVIDGDGQELGTFEYLGAGRGFREANEIHSVDDVEKKIRSIVGDEEAENVFNYWKRIYNGFSTAWVGLDGK